MVTSVAMWSLKPDYVACEKSQTTILSCNYVNCTGLQVKLLQSYESIVPCKNQSINYV